MTVPARACRAAGAAWSATARWSSTATTPPRWGRGVGLPAADAYRIGQLSRIYWRQGRLAELDDDIEVPAFFKALADTLQITKFTPLSFVSNETDVMVVRRWAATALATGKSTAMNIHHWWSFRGDKIYHYRGTEDTARTADLLSRG